MRPEKIHVSLGSLEQEERPGQEFFSRCCKRNGNFTAKNDEPSVPAPLNELHGHETSITYLVEL